MSTTAKWLKYSKATVRTVSLLLAVALISALVLDLHAHTAHATPSQDAHTAYAHHGSHHEPADAAPNTTENTVTHADELGAPSDTSHESHCDCAHCFVFVAPRPETVRAPSITTSRSRLPAQPMHSHLSNVLDRPPITFV